PPSSPLFPYTTLFRSLILPDVHFVSCLPQRKFTKRDERLFLEKILEGHRRLVRRIHDASPEAVDESFGRNVNHHHFVGLFDYPRSEEHTSELQSLAYL